MNLGGLEILIIVAAIVLLFGAGQLPKIAKSMGTFISDFNSAKEEAEEAFKTKKKTKTEKNKSKKNK